MAKRLYVGNLSYSTSDYALQDLFAQAGEVEEAVVVTDRDTGRSKGFGFVTMATDEGATAAIDKYNESEFEGRTIRVAEARPRQPRTDRGGGGGRGFGGGGGGGRW